MDTHITTHFVKTQSPELRRDVVGKAALLAGRLVGTFARMSEQADSFTLADAEALLEKLLYAYPDDVEWTLRLHRRERAEFPHDFNVVLMFGLRALRDTLSWEASFDLLLAADMSSGREVIRRARAEIALDARDEEGLIWLASVLDAHLSAADRAGVQLFLDDDHERELLERVDVSES